MSFCQLQQGGYEGQKPAYGAQGNVNAAEGAPGSGFNYQGLAGFSQQPTPGYMAQQRPYWPS